MIDRPSRDRLALALRQYVSRRVHNDELDGIVVDGRDRGAIAVKQAAWGLYDDYHQHFATGRHTIPAEGRRTIARWVLFLHSDQEYLWPEYSLTRTHNWVVNILTLGWWQRREDRCWKEFCSDGDFSCWPFHNKAELKKAVSSPRLLSGRP
jgi:hypothetical protein